MHKKTIRDTTYFYTTIREKDGGTKTIYLGKTEKEALRKERQLKQPPVTHKILPTLLIIFSCLAIFMIFDGGITGYFSYDPNPVTFSFNETWNVSESFVRISLGEFTEDTPVEGLLNEGIVNVDLDSYSFNSTGTAYIDLFVEEELVESLTAEITEEVIEETNETIEEPINETIEEIILPEENETLLSNETENETVPPSDDFGTQEEFTTQDTETCNSCNDCTVKAKTADRTLTLTQDITFATDDICINITANNLIFDCDGYSITGPVTGPGMAPVEVVDADSVYEGIEAGNLGGIVIKNCIIKNFMVGMLTSGLTDSIFYNNTVYNLYDVDDAAFEGVDGIRIAGTSRNVNISNNYVGDIYSSTANIWGLVVDPTGNDFIIENNTINNLAALSDGVMAFGALFGDHAHDNFSVKKNTFNNITANGASGIAGGILLNSFSGTNYSFVRNIFANFTTNNPAFITVAVYGDITNSNITFEENTIKQIQSGIYLTGGTNSNVTIFNNTLQNMNCTQTDCKMRGIYFDGDFNKLEIYNNTLSDFVCKVSGCRPEGIFAVDASMNYEYMGNIYNNNFTNFIGHASSETSGINFEPVTFPVYIGAWNISDNYFRNFYGGSAVIIDLENMTNSSINRNEIRGVRSAAASGARGFNINDFSNTTFNYNIIGNITDYGFSISPMAGGEIIGNVITDVTTGKAISLDSVDNLTISYNNITNNSNAFAGSTWNNCSIIGNILYNSTGAGVNINYLTNSEFEQNNLSKIGSNVLQIVFASENQINKNILSPKSSDVNGFLIYYSSNNYFQDNNVTDSGNAVLFYESANNNVINNTRFENVTISYYIQNSDNLTIGDSFFTTIDVVPLYVINGTDINLTSSINLTGMVINNYSNVSFAHLRYGNSSAYANFTNLYINDTVNAQIGFGYGNNTYNLSLTGSPGLSGKTAQIVFPLVNYPGHYDFKISRNGQYCSNSTCVRKSLNPVIFEITNFSNYSTGIFPDCGDMFEFGGYTLTSNINCTNFNEQGYALEVNSSDVTISCGGNTITGPILNNSVTNTTDKDYFYGFYMGYQNNVTIKDCFLQKLSSGIKVFQSNDSTIYNNSLKYMYTVNSVTAPTSRALYFSNSSFTSNVTQNIFNETLTAIAFSNTTNVTLVNNSWYNITYYEIYADQTSSKINFTGISNLTKMFIDDTSNITFGHLRIGNFSISEINFTNVLVNGTVNLTQINVSSNLVYLSANPGLYNLPGNISLLDRNYAGLTSYRIYANGTECTELTNPACTKTGYAPVEFSVTNFFKVFTTTIYVAPTTSTSTSSTSSGGGSSSGGGEEPEEELPFCGDGNCDANEDCLNCEEDCGPSAVCGNDRCEEWAEDKTSCPEDCDLTELEECIEKLTGDSLLTFYELNIDCATIKKPSSDIFTNLASSSLTSNLVSGGSFTSQSLTSGMSYEEAKLICEGVQAYCGDGECNDAESYEICPADCDEGELPEDDEEREGPIEVTTSKISGGYSIGLGSEGKINILMEDGKPKIVLDLDMDQPTLLKPKYNDTWSWIMELLLAGLFITMITGIAYSTYIVQKKHLFEYLALGSRRFHFKQSTIKVRALNDLHTIVERVGTGNTKQLYEKSMAVLAQYIKGNYQVDGKDLKKVVNKMIELNIKPKHILNIEDVYRVYSKRITSKQQVSKAEVYEIVEKIRKIINKI